MIQIFHAPRTRSIRIIWLCEELGIPYQRVAVDFSVAYRASPEWRAMNPVGKVPVMIDGDLKIFESGAMLQYLLDKYGKGSLQPRAGTAEHAIFLQWCWFAEATFARPLGEIVNHRRVFDAAHQSVAAINEMKDRAWLCVEALESALTGKDFLLGSEFSGADIMTGYSLMLTEWLVEKKFPDAVTSYWARLKARPGYQQAIQ